MPVPLERRKGARLAGCLYEGITIRSWMDTDCVSEPPSDGENQKKLLRGAAAMLTVEWQ